jgi:hypothetical protein
MSHPPGLKSCGIQGIKKGALLGTVNATQFNANSWNWCCFTILSSSECAS